MLHYQIDRIEHQVAEDRSQTGVFLIGPLDRGQATTLGNALRRVLIGALEGSAITAVRISGVNHEYATVPGFGRTFSTSCSTASRCRSPAAAANWRSADLW